MDKLDEYRDLIYKILSYYASMKYRYGDINSTVIVSQDRNHFLLMKEGWEGKRRVHYCLVHVEIRNGKIWIQYDGIEDGITDELVEGGVPENSIVLAFHSPEVRKHTGFAIA
ncbi:MULTISPECIES: XisI protein [unclassified Microcoleus]|uniref:XisI protein n=1 Tax=unclassified Microcoleus TaxID=2642155 RepID=UPI002FCF0609